MTDLIENYNENLINLKDKCLIVDTNKNFNELLKGVIILFIKECLLLYNKFLPTIDGLQTPECADKISNLNILLNSLETDGKILGIDCNEIIIRSYLKYFYSLYRDDIMNWNLDKFKNIKNEELLNLVMNTAKEEGIEDSASEYLNILPELILIINALKERQIIKLYYLLNNINTIMDIYLIKKSKNELKD